MNWVCWTILAFPGIKPMITVDYLLNVLLDLVWYYFVEDFCFYVHQGYWSVVFFLVVLVQLWYQGDTGFINEMGRISPFFLFFGAISWELVPVTLCMFGRIWLLIYLTLGFLLCWENIILLINFHYFITLFKIFISSWFNHGSLYISKNFFYFI